MKNNLKKISVLLLTFCLLLSLTACSSASIELKNQEVEADKTLTLTDIVTLSDTEKYTVEPAEESANIDLGKPGEYTAKYIIKKKDSDKEKEQEVSFKVVDTTKPVIGANKVLALKENETDDLEPVLDITDNSSEDLEVDIGGDYDLTTAGTYKIKVSVKDSSGNEATKDIELVIKKSSDSDSNTSSNTGASSSLGTLSGYWVNKSGNKMMLFKNDGQADSIIIDALNSGPSGGSVSGEIKGIAENNGVTTVTYKEYDTKKTGTIQFKLNDSSSLTVTSKNNLKGNYNKWSEAQIKKYWKSLGF